MFAASPEFFETMHIPLLEGRMFTLTDFEQAAQTSAATKAAEQNTNPQSPTTTTTSSPAAVSILGKEAFVRRDFANANAMGKRSTRTRSSSAPANSDASCTKPG